MHILSRSEDTGFTLIELLVVIAILAVLAVAVVLVLNPSELLKQGRDSTRLSDLASLNSALGMLQTELLSSQMGSSSVIYVSLLDPSSTSTQGTNCSSLGLPSLPSGYTYHCAASSTVSNVNGTGWVPVNFTRFSAGSPLGRLPLDPINTSSTGQYYTYVTGGSWELTSSMESSKYKLGGSTDVISKDGGRYTGLYELGTNLSLFPIDYGDTSLVGYWTFDEGTGSTAYDASGKGNTGTLVNGPSWQISSGCKMSGCLYFNGNNQYVSLPHQGGTQITYTLWIKKSFGAEEKRAVTKGNGSDTTSFIMNFFNNGFGVYLGGGTPSPGYHFTNSATLNTSNFSFIAWTYDKSQLKLYADGNLDRTVTVSRSTDFDTTSIKFGFPYGMDTEDYIGYADEMRVYNRVLSAAEVQAIYNATR